MTSLLSSVAGKNATESFLPNFSTKQLFEYQIFIEMRCYKQNVALTQLKYE